MLPSADAIAAFVSLTVIIIIVIGGTTHAPSSYFLASNQQSLTDFVDQYTDLCTHITWGRPPTNPNLSACHAPPKHEDTTKAEDAWHLRYLYEMELVMVKSVKVKVKFLGTFWYNFYVRKKSCKFYVTGFPARIKISLHRLQTRLWFASSDTRCRS